MQAINALLDEAITKRLSKYLAMKPDSDKFSDVVVKDGNVMITNLYVKPETVNAKLAAAKIPARVKMVHCNNAAVKIPWFSFKTQNVELVVDNLLILLHPLPEVVSILFILVIIEDDLFKHAFTAFHET